jgi:hypothetical protein
VTNPRVPISTSLEGFGVTLMMFEVVGPLIPG